MHGLIVRAQSGFFDVETKQGVVVAQLRGRHRLSQQESDLLALGDRVLVQQHEDGTGTIEEIVERERVLSRRAPGIEREQVLVANLDQAVFVFSCAEPDPNLRMLDRLLVVAEEQQIPAAICANKIDFMTKRQAKQIFGLYERIGYPVFYTSATKKRGIGKLRKALQGVISVFAGPSGAGKSTLLNAVQPDLGLRIGDVSQATGKGTHTTVVPRLAKLKRGGYVADTPGVKAFALWDIEPEEIDGYYREMKPLVEQCAFSDCTHFHEPGCAILEALERGEIDPHRYDSYCRLRLGDLD
ncbi:MAG TPA: ribosome small subunit-dependent GTPase A [Anaerolineae bacterium]|nr:ribosome small subunit-dependent GTPase A [Anaerolineae bacterium]